jgi:hypothetical protein
MPIPRVEHWVWRLLTAGQFYDAFIAVVALTGGAVTSHKFILDGWHGSGQLVALSAFGVCALSILRAVVTYRQQAKRESLLDLEGCLMIIHAVLATGNDRDCEQQAGLRVTVHVAIDDHRLQQVLDYVGDGRGGHTAGRVFPMQSGIAGRVYRTGEAWAAKRFAEDYEDYVSELVREWHYIEKDARKLHPATKTWMAVPLVLPGSKIEGVLYLDSTDRGYFTVARQQLVFNAASGVVRFVNRRYAKA